MTDEPPNRTGLIVIATMISTLGLICVAIIQLFGPIVQEYAKSYLATSTPYVITTTPPASISNILQPTQILECSTSMTWDMQNPILGGYPTRIGSLNSNNEWIANPSQDSHGWFQVGPYAKLNSGEYIARWYLMIDNNSSDDSDIFRFEIAEYHDNLNQTVLTSQVITRKDWDAPQTYQCFSLPFRIDSNNKTLEFRIWWFGTGVVKQLRVSVE